MLSITSGRTFDPNSGSGGTILAATATENGVWKRELRDFHAERSEREMRALMMNRHGVCG